MNTNNKTKSNASTYSPFSVSTTNSRWSYTYDPGYLTGLPEDCYPSDFEIEDYIDGGIEIYYRGQLGVSIVYTGDYWETDENYAYGNEEIYADDMEGLIEELNDFINVADNMIEEKINSETDQIESNELSQDLFSDDIKSWNDFFKQHIFGSAIRDYEIEVLEAMPDYEKVAM